MQLKTEINKAELIKKYVERSNYHFAVINNKPVLLRNRSSVPLWKYKYENTDYSTAYYKLDEAGTWISFMFWDLRPKQGKRLPALSIFIYNKQHGLQYRLFWSKWKGETIKFSFDKKWHEIITVPEDYQGAEKYCLELKLRSEKKSEEQIKQETEVLSKKDKTFIYVWDMTIPYANFVFDSLSPYIKKDEIIIALPSEQYTLLEPWKKANYTTIGIDINDKTCDILTDFFEVNTAKWNEWMKGRSDCRTRYGILKNVGLIIGYLPSFQMPWSSGDSQTEWFRHIIEVWGKGVPMCINGSHSFSFYTVNRMVQKIECPPINQTITLPTSLVNREIGAWNKVLLFNLPSVPKLAFDSEKYDDEFKKQTVLIEQAEMEDYEVDTFEK